MDQAHDLLLAQRFAGSDTEDPRGLVGDRIELALQIEMPTAGLGHGLRLFQLQLLLLQQCRALCHGVGHDVEIVAQPRELLAAGFRCAVREIACRQRLAGLHQRTQLAVDPDSHQGQQADDKDNHCREDQQILAEHPVHGVMQGAHCQAIAQLPDLFAGKHDGLSHMHRAGFDLIRQIDMGVGQLRGRVLAAGEHPSVLVQQGHVVKAVLLTLHQAVEMLLYGGDALLRHVRGNGDLQGRGGLDHGAAGAVHRKRFQRLLRGEAQQAEQDQQRDDAAGGQPEAQGMQPAFWLGRFVHVVWTTAHVHEVPLSSASKRRRQINLARARTIRGRYRSTTMLLSEYCYAPRRLFLNVLFNFSSC